MSKSSTQSRFNTFVSKVLWPEFKARGYQKTGNNFRFYNSDGWGKIVNIQKSSFSEKDTISFTVNTGLYLVKADTMFESAREERFLEPDCLIRKRIGKLNGLQKDLWYDLTESTPLEDAELAVRNDCLLFILPYLDGIQSEADICNQLFRERSPKSVEAIRALFDCGYIHEARQWLEEELSITIYRTWEQQLTALKNSLV